MNNPVLTVLEEKDLSITGLAMIAGVDAVAVRRIIRGEAKHLKGKVLDAIVKFGYDPKTLSDEYLQWRSRLAEQMISEKMSRSVI